MQSNERKDVGNSQSVEKRIGRNNSRTVEGNKEVFKIENAPSEFSECSLEEAYNLGVESAIKSRRFFS